MKKSRQLPLVCLASLLALLGLLVSNTQPASVPLARHGMVAAEQPLAAQAGLKILQEGGNAIDAACATALAIGVTNPSSSGIGGGGFMLIYLHKTGKIYALDYREKAPLGFKLALYLRDGKLDERLLRTGPLAVGIPGEVAGISAALKRFGRMKFSQVAEPAIALARDGFPCGAHLASEIARTAPALAQDPGLKAVFLNPDGSPRKTGDKIVETELASTLQSLGDDPDQRYYHGAIAQKIAALVQSKGGPITVADFHAYQALWRTPLERPYRDYQVYSMPPESSGGGELLEALEILEPGDIAGLGLNSPAYLARLIETMRQIFNDRAAYYGDPAFVHVPMDFLLSPKHIREIREKAFGGHHGALPPAPHDHGTSHLCVVDKDGNVVSLTTTINTAFGAKLTVPGLGIVLNNEMDDFELAPGIANVYGLLSQGPNSIQPGKRPVSSMSPTIVLKGGKPVLTLGGSGGPTIVTANLQVLLDILDFHLDPEQALATPRIHEQSNPPTVVVEQALPVTTRDALTEMGYKLRVRPQIGAVTAIQITPEGLSGASDPRKGGAAFGY
jgi:gamma-glutamyltranspeptidase/glutathione hydrolase